MKILQYITVRGRGVLAIVDAIPLELKTGMYVKIVMVPASTYGCHYFGSLLSPHRWKVCGIDIHAIERRSDAGGGLLLQGEYPLPAVGDELEVVR
jgi:hypothetical protein